MSPFEYLQEPHEWLVAGLMLNFIVDLMVMYIGYVPVRFSQEFSLWMLMSSQIHAHDGQFHENQRVLLNAYKCP